LLGTKGYVVVIVVVAQNSSGLNEATFVKKRGA
jgi:hypothetical protein